MLQKDGLVYCRNNAKVLVRPKRMMMHSSENHEYKHHQDCPSDGVWFDDSPTQIKDWENIRFKEEILSCFNTYESRHPLRRNKSDRAFVFQLSKLLIKLNQLVQGIKYGFLEKKAIQRTSLLMNLTARSCENMAILLERHPEYHEPPVCHWV
jgi:hypothetical protein